MESMSQSVGHFFSGRLSAKLSPRSTHLPSLFGGSETGRGDLDHAAQRLAREIHLPSVLFLERCLISIRPDTYHQLIADNPTAHMPPHHKGYPPEHLALNDVRAIR